MSFMVPLLLRDLLDDSSSSRPSRLLDQHFGCGVCADDLLAPMTLPTQSLLGRQNYFRPWRSALAQKDTGSTVAVDQDKFQVNLDVQQFAPEEISVKVSDDDNSVIVEGKHEEKQDEHGYISRHFIRRYVLPPGHDSKEIVSTLSSDGVLTITAPKVKEEGKPAERIIQITQTGPVKKIKASAENAASEAATQEENKDKSE